MQNKEELSDYLKEKMSYLKLGDGDSFKGIYKGFERIKKNRFGNATISWALAYPDDSKTIEWENGRADVVMAMMKFSVGDCIRITRTGTDKNNTSYKIETAAPF